MSNTNESGFAVADEITRELAVEKSHVEKERFRKLVNRLKYHLLRKIPYISQRTGSFQVDKVDGLKLVRNREGLSVKDVDRFNGDDGIKKQLDPIICSVISKMEVPSMQTLEMIVGRDGKPRPTIVIMCGSKNRKKDVKKMLDSKPTEYTEELFDGLPWEVIWDPSLKPLRLQWNFSLPSIM